MTLFKTMPPPSYSADILHAHGTCFHFSAKPPRDVASAANLTGHDAYLAIGAVLARAQQGELGYADQLSRIMREHEWASAWGHCGVMLSYNASASSLLQFCAFSDEINRPVGSTIEWIVGRTDAGAATRERRARAL